MPAGTAQQGSIFRWDTLKEIGPWELAFRPAVHGKLLEVDLTSGPTVRAWRSDDGTQYFCHGLTFGAKDAPGGAVSPFSGKSVETILHHHYELIAEAQARPGDILVWRGMDPDTTPHSAVLTNPILTPNKGYLHETTLLRSKNGVLPEASVTLADLFRDYGEGYNVYRRR
jgi:hypothetical protein